MPQRGVGDVEAGEPAPDELGPVDRGVAPKAVGQVAALESHVGEGEPLEARLTQVGVAQAGPLDPHVPGHGVRQPALHDVQVGVHAVIADLEVP